MSTMNSTLRKAPSQSSFNDFTPAYSNLKAVKVVSPHQSPTLKRLPPDIQDIFHKISMVPLKPMVLKAEKYIENEEWRPKIDQVDEETF
jgi:hypothetical protein